MGGLELPYIYLPTLYAYSEMCTVLRMHVTVSTCASPEFKYEIIIINRLFYILLPYLRY